MRILIVEDEFNAREGLAALIGKISSQDEVCAKAADGEEGYFLAISLKPDVVFVDIELPKLNGLQMIEKLLSSQDGVSQMPLFVILSGYAEFQYAQQAIQYGVEEYLLKPITIDKLAKILQKLKEKFHSMHCHGAKRGPEKNEILGSVLMCAENAAEALNILKQTAIPENMFLVTIYYGTDADSCGFTQVVESFCEYCNFKNHYIADLQEYKYLICLINTGDTLPNMIKKIKYNLFYLLQKSGYKALSTSTLPIGSFENLSTALIKIRNLNLWAITFGSDAVIYPELTKDIKYKDDNKIKRFNIRAITALKYDKIDELLRINKELLTYLVENRFHPNQIIKICSDYAFSILVCYKEYHMDLYEKVQNGELLDKLKKSRTLKELTDCLDAIVNMYNANSLSDLKIGSAMVRKVVNQIANSYISKVSLEDIAAQMNVSTEYLSRLFSKEVGVSFSEYLKEYRVSVAKKLMASSNYKIYEIGEKIGYKDPKYFCKVFKEVTGFSPKEYMIMQ